jgi:hypothetical protein
LRIKRAIVRIEAGTFLNPKELGSVYTPSRRRKMRTYLAIAAAAAMMTGAAIAQPANRDANTPAVNTPKLPPNPGAPSQDRIASPKGRPSRASSRTASPV